MLPPTATGRPASRRMAPVSSVVVVLPLVPVMPMMRFGRNRAANSTSLHSGNAPAQRLPHDGARVGYAGALHQHVDSVGQRGLRAEMDRDAGGGQSRHCVRGQPGPLIEAEDARRRQPAPGEQGRRPAAAAQTEYGEAADVLEFHIPLLQKVA